MVRILARNAPPRWLLTAPVPDALGDIVHDVLQAERVGRPLADGPRRVPVAPRVTDSPRLPTQGLLTIGAVIRLDVGRITGRVPPPRTIITS